MTKDAYVNMLIYERNKLNISSVTLCEGVYDEDMLYRVEKGERTMDRVIVKRLLARIGVDNGDYEHYLDYPDYELWQKRMNIIRCIEEGKLEDANKLLNEYSSYEGIERKKVRSKLEQQFCMFMRLQIINQSDKEVNDESFMKQCEEAVKLTVPNIDEKSINHLMLSPLEYNLTLEYKRRKNASKKVEKILDMYDEFFRYIDNGTYGKASQIKVYPKTVVNMYRDVVNILQKSPIENVIELYIRMLTYANKALRLLRERKSLCYMMEILEIKNDILCMIQECNVGDGLYDECERENVLSLIKVLKDIYMRYGELPYMKNDCYIYKESGIYCANEIIKTRRAMFNLSQEKLSGNEVSEGTVKRLETAKRPMKKETLKIIFSKLNLYPDSVNMGIVSERREDLDLYEELRYAIASYEVDIAKKIIEILKDNLIMHPINKQLLMRIESLNKWRDGAITDRQHIENLIEALQCTLDLSIIENADEIFVTTEELMTLYLISATYKEMGQYDEALHYIKQVWKYCQQIEDKGLTEGRMGIYELIMEYMGSLYGDIGRYTDSNSISDKLIKKCLHERRGNQLHSNIYNIAWNNNECKINNFDYKLELCRCIHLSQLIGDTNYTKFYEKKLTGLL